MIMESEALRSTGRVHRLETQEEPDVSVKVQRQEKSQNSSSQALRRGESSLTLGSVSLFVLFRPSNDWMQPNHIKEGTLLYSVCQFTC